MQVMIDPIVEEVSRVRDEHARSLGYSVAAIFEDIRRLEQQCERQLVHREPMPALEPTSRSQR